MHRSFVLAVIVAGCSSPPLHVTLAHDREAESATREQLLRILSEHDVGRFTHTRDVVVDEDAIPHSHPVLTLHTRHLSDDDQCRSARARELRTEAPVEGTDGSGPCARADDLLLSTFVHEQAHWWLDAHETETAAAVIDLRAAFPSLPVGFPDGATSERSSYEHLLVDHLEHVALRCAVGEPRATQAFAFWATDHYRTLYAIEREREPEIEAITRRHGLAYECR